MEIVAMDMKLRGMYIARQLSFHGVTFRIEEVPCDEDFKRMYDDAVKLVSIYCWFITKKDNNTIRIENNPLATKISFNLLDYCLGKSSSFQREHKCPSD